MTIATLIARSSALATAARRSRLVSQRISFLRREATKQPVVGRYVLRNEDDAVVFLRHDGLDAWTLEEMFALRVYALPDEVLTRLREISGDVRVLDLGANVGLAALFLSRQIGPTTGTAFEPDPRNADLLQRCLSANGLGARWSVVQACAGNRDGVASFLHSQSAVSRVVEHPSIEAMGVPVRDVLDHLDHADLAKLDIEGAEWQVLMDDRFIANAPLAMVVEYHREHCPCDDPRAKVVELLTGAGYVTREVHFPESANLPPGQGVIWGWRDVH